ERPEIDRWIISLLHSLIKEVEGDYENYEPTRAGRAIQHFVCEHLSNWYVRLNRKRFWGGEYNHDKIAAYQTLFTCLEKIAILAGPIAPFYSDKIFRDLNMISGHYKEDSVHLVSFPAFDENLIDRDLEERMDIAQQVSSMVLGLRRKVNLKVRQPLSRIMIPVSGKKFAQQLDAVKNLIISEVNVKDIEYLSDASGILVKNIKPDFKVLGPRFGKMMKEIAGIIAGFSQEDISRIESEGKINVATAGGPVEILRDDVEIISQDIPGWLVANEGRLTVALDITVTAQLRQEGIAREFINRIQNIRKENGFDVTDKVNILILKHEAINDAIESFRDYIGSQTLAVSVKLSDNLEQNESKYVEIDNDIQTYISITKA
ncbi:MAG: class I tRNA ligase family protein, partial [Bacteroidetes bacterium]|nr:class I tRNA ligase family protein [Bacteroidota bacterium]